MTSNVISQNSPVPSARVGFADIVGFGLNGVEIFRNDFSTEPFVAIKDFGENQGWNVNYHERILCDMTGNDEADIVGFGNKGIWVSFNSGNNTFSQPAQLVLQDFGYDDGNWRVGNYIRFASDIRK